MPLVKTQAAARVHGELPTAAENAGITQADLAKQIAISHTQMARYEIKNIYPPADVLKNLADVFETTIDFSVGRQ